MIFNNFCFSCVFFVSSLDFFFVLHFLILLMCCLLFFLLFKLSFCMRDILKNFYLFCIFLLGYYLFLFFAGVPREFLWTAYYVYACSSLPRISSIFKCPINIYLSFLISFILKYFLCPKQLFHCIFYNLI